MENEVYKIIDSQGNEVSCDIDVSLVNFIDDIEYMRQLYRQSRYTQAEQIMNRLADRLDDVMRGCYTCL